MYERSRLLELEDELLVQHIFSAARGISLVDVASTCKRLCRLARSTVESIRIEEGYWDRRDLDWAPVVTYTGCKCLEYLAPDGGVLLEAPDGTDGFGLPLLNSMLPRVCQHWSLLHELALVLQMEYPPGPHRQANQYLTAQLSTLTAIHSLRHLQLYKTAPLQDDAAQLAQLTQLTSLLLADHSYMPGRAALVTVDLQPLSAMTNLRSIAISGVCPQSSAAAQGAAEHRLAYELQAIQPGIVDMTAAAGQGTAAWTAAVLPTSLTSIVLKNFDADGLDLWTPHLLCLKASQHLDIVSYSEPSGTPAFKCFPAPLVAQLAPHLTGLTHLSFSHVSHENERVRAGYTSAAVHLPRSVFQLQQLRTLEFTWCPLSLQFDGDWAAVAALPNLTSLRGVDPLCTAPTDIKLTTLRRLHLTSYPRSNQGQWCLAATCPQLEDLSLTLHQRSDLLAAASTITAIRNLRALQLSFLYTLNEASAAAFMQLGQQLQQLDMLSVTWAGGPYLWPGSSCGSPLPRLHTFSRIDTLVLSMHMPGKCVPADCYDPWEITDTALLACLSPLTGLKNLMLCRMPAITPAVLVALQGMMPKLKMLAVVECPGVHDGPSAISWWGAGHDWAGPDLQLALAAMQDAERLGRPSVNVEVFIRVSEYYNKMRELPCDIKHITAQESKF